MWGKIFGGLNDFYYELGVQILDVCFRYVKKCSALHVWQHFQVTKLKVACTCVIAQETGMEA